MEKEIIQAPSAPKPIGPYSVAIRLGNLVFCSGQAGLDPNTGELVSGGIEPETRQVLRNLQSVLEAAGTRMENVVKTTVFLKDMADFGKMNAIYAEFLGVKPPARTTVQAAALPKNALVEIDVIAVIPEDK